MRCDRLYLDEVVNTQGDLFGLAFDNKLSIIDFGEYYLNNKIRSYIDSGLIEYCTMRAERLFELLDIKKVKINYEGFTKDEHDKAVWIGKFYAISQWYSDMSSAIIINKVKIQEVYENYKTLSSMDMEIASKIYLRNMGIL